MDARKEKEFHFFKTTNCMDTGMGMLSDHLSYHIDSLSAAELRPTGKIDQRYIKQVIFKRKSGNQVMITLRGTHS